jgi:hypothetical protein
MLMVQGQFWDRLEMAYDAIVHWNRKGYNRTL